MSFSKQRRFSFLAVTALILFVSLLLANCGGGGGGGGTILNSTYTVRYSGNGNTGGSAPTDATNYEAGQTVTVLGNTDLVKTGYSFNGWNTLADGTGTTYAQGQTFTMGSATVFLYAKWTAILWTGTKQLGVAGANTVANSIAVDVNGNVYVAGNTEGDLDGNALNGLSDFFLTKYNLSGDKLSTTLNGATSADTVAYGVTVDASRNVYVAGSTNGGLDGNTLKGTGGGTDFFLTKYNLSGDKLSTTQTGTAGALTDAYGVAVDGSRNVYVVGSTDGGLDGNNLMGGVDFFLTMYDSLGSKVSTTQLGVAGASTEANGVAVDANRNVYVVGYTDGGLDGNTLMGDTGGTDFFLTKYDSLGSKVSTTQLGVSGALTVAYGVAVDGNGNVYVAGSTDGDLDGKTLNGTVDFFLTKYDSSGAKLSTTLTGTAGAYTEAFGVAVDGSNNVYVVGYTDGDLDGNTSTGTKDLFLTKYDSAGSLQYTKQLGAAGQVTVAYSVAVDGLGSVYVAGYTSGDLDGNILTGSEDFFVTKYDSAGNKQ